MSMVAGAATTTLVARGSVWRYLDNGSNQGTAWRSGSFDDSSWKSGPAELGYGDGGEATVVGYGPDPAHKFRTTYFRRSFAVSSPESVSSLALGLRRDDGAAVYVNGVEVVRSNLPSGALDYLTGATTWDTSETTYFSFSVPPSVLVAGNNTIAVEVHQNGWASSDVSMDLDLVANGGGSTTTTSTTTTAPTTTTTAAPGTWTCSAGYVALTFDDGPDINASRDNTPKVLDALKARGVHATFFILGEHVADPQQPGRPDLVARVAAEGHTVGNHSYQHLHLPTLDDADVTYQISHNEDVIQAAGGPEPTLFRPPYGDTNSRIFGIAESLGEREVLWDLSPGDTGATSASWVVDHVMESVVAGSIVVLHDGTGPYTGAAMPTLLESLRQQGFCPGLIEPTSTYNPQVRSYVRVVPDPNGPH
jgi:peptidoglycan/xylan/chitin deacetylase (PgdA/CDA1 family)